MIDKQWQTVLQRDLLQRSVFLLFFCRHNIRPLHVFVIAIALTYYSLFTSPTRTRQNCIVLSCPCRRCEQNWRQDKAVLSCLDNVWVSHPLKLGLKTTYFRRVSQLSGKFSDVYLLIDTRYRQSGMIGPYWKIYKESHMSNEYFINFGPQTA